MWEDPIVAEVHKIREAHAAKFNYDLQVIYRDLKEQEKHSSEHLSLTRQDVASLLVKQLPNRKKTSSVKTGEAT